jgi:DNA mismatch repair protein MutS2
MKIYPDNLPDLLDFHVILDHLEEGCYGPRAKQLARQLKPSSDAEKIELQLSEANEFFMAFMRGDEVSVAPYPDIEKEIHLLGIENSALTASQFFQVRKALQQSFRLLQYFHAKEEVYPYLVQKLSAYAMETWLLDVINEVLDKDGIVRDDASPELRILRKEQQLNRQTSDRAYRAHIQRLKRNNQLADFEESYVNGRRVLGILAEFKREVKGIILSQSATGKIAFIEPQNVIELNNEKLRLEEEEKKEVYRILKILTDRIRGFKDLIQDYYSCLIAFDLLESKAKLARKLKATKPILNTTSRQTQLTNAFHPVLYLTQEAKGIPTVPIQVNFQDSSRIMVISGPNAGGKSITLKTIGLLQLMLQCGLLLPVSARSEFCIQQQLFGDIGDSQSIEDGLSTYSSRLQKMNFFLKHMHPQTLFLIDEFGTGSDPDMGGAMAEVILNKFNETHSFGVVTTHFTNLKLLANHNEGIFNACMLFNSRTLKPLYQLQVGEPGSSFTFEVAQKIGLPQDIIELAKQKLSREKLMMDKLLSQLQVEKNSLSKIKRDLQKQMGKTTAEKREFQELNDKLEHTIERTMEHREERKKLIDYGKKLYQLTQEWTESGNKKAIIEKFVKLASHELAKVKQQEAYERTEAFRMERLKTMEGKVAAGTKVRLLRSKEIGVVQSLKGVRAKVQFGRVVMNIGIEKLELVKQDPPVKP